MNQEHERRTDFTNQNFQGQNLEGRNFTDCDLRGANFTNAILCHADFTRAKLDGKFPRLGRGSLVAPVFYKIEIVRQKCKTQLVTVQLIPFP